MNSTINIRIVLASILAMLTLSACNSWDVKSDFDPEISFASMKTFAIIQDGRVPNDILAQEDIVRKRIFAAVDTQMIQKGFTRAANPETADLAILIYAGVRERVNYSTVGMSYGGYWGYGGPGMYSTQVVENRYAEGTLHIDMFDSKKKMLAWKGEATGALQQARSPQERQEIVHEVVQSTMRSFPPQK